MMMGAGAEVFVRRGRLMFRVLTPMPAMLRGFPLHPDDAEDPFVFRVDLSEYGLCTMRIVFGRGRDDGAMRVHLEVMPLTLRKRA